MRSGGRLVVSLSARLSSDGTERLPRGQYGGTSRLVPLQLGVCVCVCVQAPGLDIIINVGQLVDHLSHHVIPFLFTCLDISSA